MHKNIGMKFIPRKLLQQRIPADVYEFNEINL